MENFPHLRMIFPIQAYGNMGMYGKFQSANKKFLHVCGTFKSMEEKPYLHV